jgi:hypothetical protein
MNSRRPIVLIALLALTAFGLISPAAAQTPQAAPKPLVLSVESIMRGPDLVGTEPSVVGWSMDGQKFYFRWKKPAEKTAEVYFITPKDFTPKKAAADELQNRPLDPASGGAGFRGFGGGAAMILDKAKKRALLNQGGDLALLDLATNKSIPLLATDARESGAGFTFDEKGVVFTAEDNLFVLALDGRGLRQMTSFSRRTPPAPPAKPDELDKWYRDQQTELFLHFKQNLDTAGRGGGGMRGLQGAGGGPAAGPRRRPFVLKENQSVGSLELSPDEKFVLFYLSEPDPGEKSTIVPNYVTRSGFTETIPSHAKAGYPGRLTKAGLMDTSTGEIKWLDFGQGERRLNPVLVAGRKNGSCRGRKRGSEGQMAGPPRSGDGKDVPDRDRSRRSLGRRTRPDERLLVAGRQVRLLHFRKGRLRPALQNGRRRFVQNRPHPRPVRSPVGPTLP